MKQEDIPIKLREAFSVAGIPLLTQDNVDIKNAPNALWVQYTYLPNEPFTVGIESRAPMRHTGVVHLNVMTPRGNGDSAAVQVATSIIDIFPRGRNIESVRITKSYRKEGMYDNHYYYIPVVVAWLCDIMPVLEPDEPEED